MGTNGGVSARHNQYDGADPGGDRDVVRIALPLSSATLALPMQKGEQLDAQALIRKGIEATLARNRSSNHTPPKPRTQPDPRKVSTFSRIQSIMFTQNSSPRIDEIRRSILPSFQSSTGVPTMGKGDRRATERNGSVAILPHPPSPGKRRPSRRLEAGHHADPLECLIREGQYRQFFICAFWWCFLQYHHDPVPPAPANSSLGIGDVPMLSSTGSVEPPKVEQHTPRKTAVPPLHLSAIREGKLWVAKLSPRVHTARSTQRSTKAIREPIPGSKTDRPATDTEPPCQVSSLPPAPLLRPHSNSQDDFFLTALHEAAVLRTAVLQQEEDLLKLESQPHITDTTQSRRASVQSIEAEENPPPVEETVHDNSLFCICDGSNPAETTKRNQNTLFGLMADAYSKLSIELQHRLRPTARERLWRLLPEILATSLDLALRQALPHIEIAPPTQEIPKILRLTTYWIQGVERAALKAVVKTKVVAKPEGAVRPLAHVLSFAVKPVQGVSGDMPVEGLRTLRAEFAAVFNTESKRAVKVAESKDDNSTEAGRIAPDRPIEPWYETGRRMNSIGSKAQTSGFFGTRLTSPLLRRYAGDHGAHPSDTARPTEMRWVCD